MSASGRSKANNGIWVVNSVDGSGAQHPTSYGNWPVWSPDGTEMAFSYQNEVWRMSATVPYDPSPVSACASSTLGITGGIIDVVWSPGAEILFGGYAKTQRNYEIFACDPIKGLTQLTTSAKYNFEPSWSPSASMIAWASGRSPAGIWIMKPDGSLQETLPQLSGGRQPSWGL